MQTRALKLSTLAVLLFAALLVQVAPAAAASAPKEKTLYTNGPDGRYLLSGQWYVRMDPYDVGSKNLWQRQAGLEDWQKTVVPKSCNANDFSDASYAGGVCWYRIDFRTPKKARAQLWAIRFESANYYTKAWINGVPIGQNRGDFIAFELFAQKLKKNGVNSLVVRIDSRRQYGDIPEADKLGWWNWWGINREVYLRKVGKLDATNVQVRPIVPCAKCTATVIVKMTVRNYTDHKQPLDDGARLFQGTISGPGGFKRRIKFPKKAVKARKFVTFQGKVRVPSPRLWSIGKGTLYTVKIRLGEAGQRSEQTLTYRIGIRKWQVNDRGRLLLNGKPVNLRGAAIHEYTEGYGAALSPKNHVSNIRYLQGLGANFTRTHYPFHPRFLELADRNGIVIWSEIPFYQLSKDYLGRKEIRDRGLSMLDGMMRAQQNNPSVFAYSIFNELPSKPDESSGQGIYITQACKMVHDLDPSRLCAAAIPGYPSVPAQRSYRQLDVLGLNLYFGWYHGPNGQIDDRNLLPGYLDQMHVRYPNKALIATEFGAEAGCNGDPAQKGTYEFQIDWLRFTLGHINARDFINGASVWSLKNFVVKPNWKGGADVCIKSPFHQKGLLDRHGAKKPSYDVIAGIYKATPAFR